MPVEGTILALLVSTCESREQFLYTCRVSAPIRTLRPEYGAEMFDRAVRLSWFGARVFLYGSVENKVDMCRFITEHMPYLLSVISPPVRYDYRHVPLSRATGQPGRLKSRSFLLFRM